METIYQFGLKAGELSIPEKEVYRYLGYMGHTPAALDAQRIAEGIKKTEAAAMPKACYGLFDITVNAAEPGADGLQENRILDGLSDEDGDAVSAGEVVMPYGKVYSKSLAAWIKGCTKAYIFAATVGAGVDRMIKTSAFRSMSEAAILQACGAAAVEEFCNILNRRLNEEAGQNGYEPVKRYSPGYGDLDLEENQKGVFAVLNPGKFIGLSLMDTCIMSPEKSVTAIIGLKEKQ
ncbi:MAG: hypothetical protein K5686_04220 [Lachnospiraceae bacterium]|nr:hypothetical protein [Lachnospiraceae bacterium]